MGLNLSSDHPSLMLNIQLCRDAMKARFVVSKELQTSPIILGSVFFLINPPSAAEIFFEFFLEIWICCLHNHLVLFIFICFFILLL
jgi:hypothetical protein